MNLKKEIYGRLWSAFQNSKPETGFNEKGYVGSIEDNLVEFAHLEDFKSDMEEGDGNELDEKFKAIHSSSALCVNCFAPFRKRIEDLMLPLGGEFFDLKFERKCQIWPGVTPPNLDVILSGKSGIVAIESKFTEYLNKKKSKIEFKKKYHELNRIGYFEEMKRIDGTVNQYNILDAAQLIKHSFGLAKSYPDQDVLLLYVYWEPANADDTEFKNTFELHRYEIEKFSDRVNPSGNSNVKFAALSYNQLWNFWRKSANAWLSQHLNELEGRYLIDI